MAWKSVLALAALAADVRAVVPGMALKGRGLARVDLRLTSRLRGGARVPQANVEVPHYPWLGLPGNRSWGFDKIPPKPSLAAVNPKIGQVSSARQWPLNLIELVHWTPLVPLVLASASVLTHRDFWLKEFGMQEWRLLMLLLSPIIQFAGGLGAVTMHIYEGWIVAPFKNPLKESVDILQYNNAWLRAVAYRLLFTVQCAGMNMVTLALLDFGEKGTPFAVGLAIGAVILSYIGDQNAKPHLAVGWAQPFGKGSGPAPIFPLSYYTLVPFVLSGVVNGLAYWKVGSAHGCPWALAAPLVFGLGGSLEGLIAESFFNQWLHGVAFLIVNVGAVLQWMAYEKIASNGA